MFYLKQYDTVLLSFEILEDPLEGQKCRIHEIDEAHVNLLPVGLKKTDEGLMSWLRSRIIPRNREYVDALLAKSGLSHNDTKGILQVCRVLSLNDSYWVVEEGFNGKYADYNLYEHDFVKVLSLIACTGHGSSSRAKGFSSSPEFTTTGMLRKGWRRLGGKVLLYKGGTSGAANTGNEPYSEFYAAQVAERMGIRHVPYGLSMWKGCMCSTCELFCDIDHSFVPIYRFMDKCTLRTVADYLRSLGGSYYDCFADMLVFDALICNEDRHFGNFGLMVDNKTNQPYAFAPLFDHGLSLFNYAMPDDMKTLDEYAKTRSSAYGVPFDNIVREFISPRQKEQLRKMIGFRFEKHPRYNLSADRLKAIEKTMQNRVQAFLSIPDHD
ncbi:MAG: XRE family transcriptional regulator [Clostridia bacterium]|nr:XRE family transcriptional regulator [Clostridia bacterium]